MALTVNVTLVERALGMRPIVGLFFLLSLSGAYGIWLAAHGKPADPLATLLWAEGLALASLAFVPFLLKSRWIRPSRLHICPERIEFEAGEVFGLKVLPSWSVEKTPFLGEIEVRVLPVPALTAIVELQHLPRRMINLTAWVEEGKEDWLPRKLPKEGIVALIAESPAYRALVSMGYTVRLPGREAAAATDLTGHPMGKAALGLFFALFLYALLDFALGAERYVDFQPYPWMAVGGVAAAVVTWAMLGRTAMDRVTKAGMTFLVALAAAGTTFPGLLRVNLFTDTLHQTRVYRLVERRQDVMALNGYWAVLEAEEPDAPRLVLNDPWGYFEQRRMGSRYRFELRRGMLGFQQIRLDPKNRTNPAPVALD